MKRRHRAGRRQKQRKLLRRLQTDVVILQSISDFEHVHSDNKVGQDSSTETSDRAYERLTIIQPTTTSTDKRTVTGVPYRFDSTSNMF